MDSRQKSGSARGLTPLGRTSEDVAEGVYRVQAASGAIAKLTARQVEIVSMSMAEKQHVPFNELTELGKVMMKLQEENIDALFQELDENPPQAPEFIPEPYEYTPLKKPDSLRLLQMYPEDENGMVQISLDEYDLDQHIPNYYCLSYCWNNPHAKSNDFNVHTDTAEDYDDSMLYPIACNGRLLYVRANLYDALKQVPAAPGLQLKRWYDFNGSGEKCTDLHISAAEGDLALTKTNIFRGAIIDTKDTKGRTALGLAVINGHLPVVKTLLEAGSDPQIRDHNGSTCLDYALLYDRHEIADCLLTFDVTKVRKFSRKNKHVGQGTVKAWIDAICINQQDLQEKNEQVSVMNRIYNQAAFVTIWLGRDDGTGATASDAVQKLFSITAISRDPGKVDFEPYKATDPATCQRAGLPYINEFEWFSLAALYLRQQFRRIWCLQEAVLGDNVVMYMGQHHIPWDEFMMVTEMLYMQQRKYYAVPPSSRYRHMYTAAIESEVHLVSELRMRRTLDKSSEEHRERWFRNTKKRFWRGEGQSCQIPLLEMILSAVTFECSDPHDHIYGLVGMCKGHPESPTIEIDYTKSWEEVYTDVMRLCLCSTDKPSLGLVASIRDSANYNNENLPSWVLHFGQAGISPIWRPNHAAAGGYSETWDIARSSSGRENELIVEGTRVDIVEDVATKRPGMEEVSMCNFDMKWPSLILRLPQTYPHTMETRTEVLWRTLCADSTSQDDIQSSIRQHTRTSESTSAEPLSQASKAPTKYAGQFRTQLYASILSYAEKLADMRLKYRASRAGIMLQALMSVQSARDEGGDTGNVRTISGPSQEEEAGIRDITLEGPYFSNPSAKQAIEAYELLYQTDSRQFGGPGCSTPSKAGISAFLRKPTYRIWYPNAADPGSDVSITPAFPAHSKHAQHADTLPPDQNGFLAQFILINGGRRLFVTENQQYLGLGPMSMQPGDEVWLVKGSKVPFLLRKVGEEDLEDTDHTSEQTRLATSSDKEKGKQAPQKRSYYKYVGDLYVHGIMSGEAVNETNQWEEIALL